MKRYPTAHGWQPLPGTDHVSLEARPAGSDISGGFLHRWWPVARRSPEQRRRTSWVVGYRHGVIVLDAAAAAAALLLVMVLRPGPALMYLPVPVGLVLAASWVPAVALCHGYEPKLLGAGPEEYRALFRASVLVFATLSGVCLVLQAPIPRSVVLLVLPTTLLVSAVLRRRLRTWLAGERVQGRCQQRTVAVGRGDSVGALIQELRDSPGRAFDVVAVCANGQVDAPPEDQHTDEVGQRHIAQVPVHGTAADVLAAVDYFDADVVAVAADPELSGHALRQIAWQLEERQVELIVSPGILEVAGPRLSIRAEAGVTLLHVERPISSGVRMLLKTCLDRSLALMITLVLLPVLVVVGLSVRFSSPGPVLYHQERVGTRGQSFRMLKFRSMVVGSDTRVVDPSGDDPRGLKAGRDGAADPAVTRVGRVLRRYSLDELPQLINVLRGEMSLVGPRPPLPAEVARYEPTAMRRLRVQPGMTGLWQVSGRSDLDWEQSLRLDLWYVDNWSPMTDLQILFRTARAVVRGSGAY